MTAITQGCDLAHNVEWAIKNPALDGDVGFELLSREIDSDTHAPCWIRTSDRLLRRQLLYPAELREH